MPNRSRRLGAVVARVSESEPDTRPIGSLLNGDSCSAAFAREIHRSALPGQGEAESCGINTTNRRMLPFYDPMRRRREEEE